MELVFDEKFKSCPYNDALQVSQYGRVADKSGKILQQQTHEKYLVVVNPENSDAKEKVHRLVALTWLNNDYKAGKEVHHIDKNGYNNRVDNLMWVTGEEHAEIHGWQEIDEFGSWIKGI